MSSELLGDVLTTGRYAAVSIGVVVVLRTIVLLVLIVATTIRALDRDLRDGDPELREHSRLVLFLLLSALRPGSRPQ